MLKLHVIVASTRPGRVGLPVAEWFCARAKEHAKFEAELADLKGRLPLLDEPKHPRFRQYTQEHTKAFSAIIDAADAFVFVTPEYNYSAAPSLLNALDFLFHEWTYKPGGFVSYGGISGGMRSVQMTKQLLTSLKVMPMVEAVTIPMVVQHMDGGRFKGGEPFDKAATTLLDELLRWAEALKTMRPQTSA